MNYSRSVNMYINKTSCQVLTFKLVMTSGKINIVAEWVTNLKRENNCYLILIVQPVVFEGPKLTRFHSFNRKATANAH